MGPAGVSTRTGEVAIPRATAMAAAPVDPVPLLMVSPAPRSQNRTSIVCSSTGFTNDTLVRFGKYRWRSISAPGARQSKSKCSTGTAHCGLPTQSRVTSRGPHGLAGAALPESHVDRVLVDRLHERHVSAAGRR